MATTIDALWRFPVKSMGGEQLQEAVVTSAGIVGDRGYALIDKETGKVVSAKHPARWRGILDCRATYVEEPRLGEPVPAVLIELPGGTSVHSDDAEVDRVLSEFFDREVTLSLPAGAYDTIDEYVPDDANLRPEGYRDELTETRIGAAMFRHQGIPPMVPDASFFDLMPISVLTTASLARLAELAPGSVVDQRRFRMNLIIAADDIGFIENDWPGKALTIGAGTTLFGIIPTPRCVMTNLGQGDLPKDANILRTTNLHNSRQVLEVGKYPCLGVYMVVAAEGAIRVGDSVVVTDPAVQQ
ncbi:MOSC domain-containing protein [Nocardia sp. XZ_19_385]|uniref:MOSC domain-containing protein n=1 Tax=Nocardia sp. XZ_19_385 TaxID=2769488 RepID=UPI0018906059|nr:MOSC N-terminal beta barrel domain-containing protein [Nocardia sp. XZ_19_385]